jgi:hypothetical protein
MSRQTNIFINVEDLKVSKYLVKNFEAVGENVHENVSIDNNVTIKKRTVFIVCERQLENNFSFFVNNYKNGSSFKLFVCVRFQFNRENISLFDIVDGYFYCNDNYEFSVSLSRLVHSEYIIFPTNFIYSFIERFREGSTISHMSPVQCKILKEYFQDHASVKKFKEDIKNNRKFEREINEIKKRINFFELGDIVSFVQRNIKSLNNRDRHV